jgi:hypothetical protein
MRKPKGFMSNVAATGIGKRSPADVRFDRMRRQPREVFDELRRRAGHGNAIGLGANRGDSHCPAARLQIGSWGAAVAGGRF